MRKIAQKELAGLLATLAHPLRLALVFALADGERDVSTLVMGTGASQTAVSQALARLRAARLVSERRAGRHVHYGLTLPQLPAWLDGGYALLVDETAHAAVLHDAIEAARTLRRPTPPLATPRPAALVSNPKKPTAAARARAKRST